MDSLQKLEQKLQYIHNNPMVRLGKLWWFVETQTTEWWIDIFPPNLTT